MKSISLLIFAFIIFSCTKERADQEIEKPRYCDSIAFTFEKDILPVFTSNCNFSDCHAAGGTASFDFTKYNVVAARIRAGTLDYRIDLPFNDPQHMPDKMHLSECDYFIIKNLDQTRLSRKIIYVMKNILIFILLITFVRVKAQPVFSSESGNITFYSYAPLEDIKATSTQINSFINTATGELAFVIPMRSFHFEKSLMEEHFNEKYLETDKYPQATFKGTLSEKVDVKNDGKIQLNAKGKLTIHGKEKEVTENGMLEIIDGKIILTTEFYVALNDFNITKPQIVFNNIADTIEIKMKATYIPYKKK